MRTVILVLFHFCCFLFVGWLVGWNFVLFLFCFILFFSFFWGGGLLFLFFLGVFLCCFFVVVVVVLFFVFSRKQFKLMLICLNMFLQS